LVDSAVFELDGEDARVRIVVLGAEHRGFDRGKRGKIRHRQTPQIG
jgi:hypothetical protein